VSSRLEHVLLFVGFGVVPACSSEFKDDPPRPIVDASVDAPLVPESGPPGPDAMFVPPGDICGDRSGLQVNAPWPMLGGCPKRGGYAYRPATFSTAVRWTTDVPAAESSPAITAEGFLWVGTTDGRAVAMSAYYGNLSTSVKLGSDPVRSSPSLASSGRAVFGYANYVYALEVGASSPIDAGSDADAATTPTSPSLDAEGPVTSSAAITKDATIVVATTNGRVAALRHGGTPKWSVVTDGDGVASPAIGTNGRIYVAGAGNALFALEPETGGKIWQASIGAALRFISIGGDDTVYVAAADGKLHAIAADGTSKWTFAAGAPISGAPAVLAGVVYVGAEDKKLYAVSTIDGAKKWEYATLGTVASPTIASDGTVYVGSSDGNLYALKPSGLLYFAVNVKGAVKGAPAVGQDGTVYVTTTSSIVAVGP
jgi:outer membrane protein assembly factor BamB